MYKKSGRQNRTCTTVTLSKNRKEKSKTGKVQDMDMVLKETDRKYEGGKIDLEYNGVPIQ